MNTNTNSLISIDLNFKFRLGMPVLELAKLIRWLIPIAIPMIHALYRHLSGALVS